MILLPIDKYQSLMARQMTGGGDVRLGPPGVRHKKPRIEKPSEDNPTAKKQPEKPTLKWIEL